MSKFKRCVTYCILPSKRTSS